jgi:hypothetical protein
LILAIFENDELLAGYADLRIAGPRSLAVFHVETLQVNDFLGIFVVPDTLLAGAELRGPVDAAGHWTYKVVGPTRFQ